MAGLCVALATLIHPSQETPAAILSQEGRLIAGHWLFTFFCGFLLLGLPGVYAAQAERAGRLGLASGLLLFFGTLFFAVSNDYGFVAPPLAAQAPAMLEAINAYPPVVAMNGLLIVCFFPGSILFGLTIWRAGLLPRQGGVLMAIGAPLYLVGGALGQLYVEALWTIAILGALALGVGLAWAGYALWMGYAAPVLRPTGHA
jgi:hypothetical protein